MQTIRDRLEFESRYRALRRLIAFPLVKSALDSIGGAVMSQPDLTDEQKLEMERRLKTFVADEIRGLVGRVLESQSKKDYAPKQSDTWGT